jgi:hypothetical protein
LLISGDGRLATGVFKNATLFEGTIRYPIEDPRPEVEGQFIIKDLRFEDNDQFINKDTKLEDEVIDQFINKDPELDV